MDDQSQLYIGKIQAFHWVIFPTTKPGKLEWEYDEEPVDTIEVVVEAALKDGYMKELQKTLKSLKNNGIYSTSALDGLCKDENWLTPKLLPELSLGVKAALRGYHNDSTAVRISRTTNILSKISIDVAKICESLEEDILRRRDELESYYSTNTVRDIAFRLVSARLWTRFRFSCAKKLIPGGHPLNDGRSLKYVNRKYGLKWTRLEVDVLFYASLPNQTKQIVSTPEVNPDFFPIAERSATLQDTETSIIDDAIETASTADSGMDDTFLQFVVFLVVESSIEEIRKSIAHLDQVLCYLSMYRGGLPIRKVVTVCGFVVNGTKQSMNLVKECVTAYQEQGKSHPYFAEMFEARRVLCCVNFE